MTKPFKTIDEQLDILRSRQLTIDNEQVARHALTNYGYYEIVNGYKSFLLEEQDSETFRDGETFSHLLAIYELDKQIKHGVLQATLEIELSLRTAIAYTIAEAFGEKQENYLKAKNYQRGKRRANSTSYPLYQLLRKLNHILNDDIEPYKHYREHHGNIPPWILLKGTTFGNLLNFYKVLKPAQKAKVISLCLGIEERFVTDYLKSMFVNGLEIIHRYRNRAAHSGRIFNYRSDKIMPYHELFHSIMGIDESDYKQGLGHSSLYTLLTILKLFDNSNARLALEVTTLYHVNKHSQQYPNDLKLISKETELPLQLFETTDRKSNNSQMTTLSLSGKLKQTQRKWKAKNR